MKVILALFTVCLFSVSLATAQTPAPTPPPSGPVGPVGPAPAKASSLTNFEKWFAFESTGGGFTIKFPVKPVSEPGTPVPGTSGLLRYVTMLSAGAGRFFQIHYYDFQGHLNSPELATTAGMNEMAKFGEGRGLKLKTRQTTQQGKCQIEDAILAGEKTGVFPIPSVMKVRTLFSGDKVYVMLAESPDLADDIKATDYFLDSFAVTGGCVAAIKSATAKLTKGNDEGTLDSETGWRHFASNYGISFLLPTGATTERWEDSALGRTVNKFSYLSATNGVVFSVEIVNTFSVRDVKDSVRAGEALDLTIIQLRANFAKNNYVLGTCIPQSAGATWGRECSVTHTDPDQQGRARIFVTPNWTFVLTALRETETTDLAAENRFFNSVTIDPK